MHLVFAYLEGGNKMVHCYSLIVFPSYISSAFAKGGSYTPVVTGWTLAPVIKMTDESESHAVRRSQVRPASGTLSLGRSRCKLQ